MIQLFSCHYDDTTTISYAMLSHVIWDKTLASRAKIAPQSLLALALLSKAMKRLFPHLPRPLLIGRDALGKPFFTDYPYIYFNLSHSAGRIVCAISDQAIGIDIQQETARSLSIADRFFHPKEASFLSTLDEDARQTAFYRLWVLKEAYLKATGDGLYKPLADFCISLVPKPCILKPADSKFHLSLVPSGFSVSFHVGLCAASSDAAPDIQPLTL